MSSEQINIRSIISPALQGKYIPGSLASLLDSSNLTLRANPEISDSAESSAKNYLISAKIY